MFPIIWRFLLTQYLKVMALCSVAIVVVLLTTRLDEIAHFASLDSSFFIVVMFVLYQIPYVLPIAIPVSCLISSILLVQRLSKTHELTAFRACGMGLKDFMAPVIFAGALLTIVNFYFVSELATSSHLNTYLWKSELRSLNPLLVLRNKHLMKTRGGYFDVLGASTMGESAGHVVMALPNRSSGRISLLLVEKMEAFINGGQLKPGNVPTGLQSSGISLITTLKAKNLDAFDHLMIENMDQTIISGDDFAQIMQRSSRSVNNDHLTMSLLLSRVRLEQKLLTEAAQNHSSDETLKTMRQGITRAYSEILRRFSAALAAFTFTLMGASFGISINRHTSNRSVIAVIVITALYLTLFFAAKSVEDLLLVSSALYILPHLVIIALSIRMLRRVSNGIED